MDCAFSEPSFLGEESGEGSGEDGNVTFPVSPALIQSHTGTVRGRVIDGLTAKPYRTRSKAWTPSGGSMKFLESVWKIFDFNVKVGNVVFALVLAFFFMEIIIFPM